MSGRKVAQPVDSRRSWSRLGCASLILPLLVMITEPVEAQSEKQDQTEWRTLQSPQEVPDYIAWRYFFWSVDRNYRLGAGFYYGFINLRLKLGPLFKGDRNAGERVAQALADRAALAYRDDERFRSESQYRRRFLGMGAITAEEFEIQNRAAFDQQVLALERACNTLHREILEIAPQTGEVVWERIYDHVQTGVKSSTSVAIEGGGNPSTRMLEFRCSR